VLFNRKKEAYMGYITAIEASRRIGVGERTIRLWISQGKLKAEKVSVNRLAIDEKEVDKIAKKRSKYRDSRQEKYDNDVYERIAELEKQVTLMNDRIAVLEAEKEAASNKVVPVRSPVRQAASVSGDLPDGCIYARDFARQHGVPESSFRRHCSTGIGGDVVETEKSSKGRYLTPVQQEATLQFWDRHDVGYTSLGT
jgi:excisionase family DNA binding protein